MAPQSLASLQKEQGWIRLTSDGNTAYNAVPDQIGGSTTLNSGMESSLTLNLKGQSTEPDPDLDWANRKMWVYGVKSPVFDADKAPVYTFTPTEYPAGEWYVDRTIWSDGTYTDYYFLPWAEGCGWYDCNKTYAWDGAKDDYLCWAASSSNILHW